MRVLIVGGAGYIGAYSSLFFDDLGHDVTIMSRSAPTGTSRLAELPFLGGNYVEEAFDDGRLEGYDWLIFAAGNDLRQFPKSGEETEAEFFERANVEALPRFFEYAKRAGVRRAVYMGSYYSFVAPQSIEHIPYIRSRHLADAAICSLTSENFNVCSCALPYIVGNTPAYPARHLKAYANYALGRLPEMPVFAPPGGANFMTSRSVAQAMLGALERGEGGKSYLVGDANMSWKAFLEAWFEAAGRPIDLPVREHHPLIQDFTLEYMGYGATDYEPPAEETALLGYERGVVRQEIENCVRFFKGQ
jgi:nucleoside-diphosphate-sugar epimerase